MADPIQHVSEKASGAPATSGPDTRQAYPFGFGPGTRLGRYSLAAPLGSGGMGVVYRARDERLERDVAVKVLTPGALSGDARRRFHKEALALAKLSHSHIAAIFDVGEQEGIDYIVMECVSGHSLAERLAAGPLPVKDATAIALQIAQALEEAHEQGVVHRDLKPANVMITPKGQAKVLDFGLAKLLSSRAADATVSALETGGLLGTPLYMSPEQALGNEVDARTDLWSLGVVFYESLAGTRPFQANSSVAILRAVADHDPQPIGQLCPGLPALAVRIVTRALTKDPAARYQSAAEMVHDLSELAAQFSSPALAPAKSAKSVSRISAAALLVVIALGAWFYRRVSQRNWAHHDAPAQVAALISQNQPLAAFDLLDKARKILPADLELQQIAAANSRVVSVTSSPAGATLEIQDYAAPNASWHRLGTTPLTKLSIPKGYFRWKLSKAGIGETITAPTSDSEMDFPLDQSLKAPADMVFSPADSWADYVGFVGWLGPYNLPSYYIDRYEVTNRDYQKFVDGGGYANAKYWPQTMTLDGHDLAWADATAKFRDQTGRSGPSTWTGGHYPEGQADYPVSGVSWFEASAYAAFMGKTLPTLAQFFQNSPPELSRYAMRASNFSGNGLAPVGKFSGVGPHGTFDMAGNVREWAANATSDGNRLLLGGSWQAPVYVAFDPESLSPFSRSETNGFRCVRNLGALPPEATAPVKHSARDFTHFTPVSEEVFRAYQLLYAYPKTPLNAKSEGIVKETVDWREEKVTYSTGYRGERMAAYLFIPKNVKPPYQTVLFFPSARVDLIRENDNGRALGDLKFFDYVVQSGRAVLYPTYQDTYERRVDSSNPSGDQDLELTADRYKDAARSFDYLSTRPDIDNTRLAYLGVSMGSAEGIIATELLQDRLKTAIFLDGGYFLEPPPPGGDQAEFAVRMKKPVLMVNGRYDFAFNVQQAQDPLFNMLGTPPADKQHILLEASHDVTEQRPLLVDTVISWLDKYLGRVGQ